MIKSALAKFISGSIAHIWIVVLVMEVYHGALPVKQFVFGLNLSQFGKTPQSVY